MAEPSLRHLYLLPSGACNLSCRHCWVSAPPSDRGFEPRPRAENELTVREIEDIGSQASRLGAKTVKLTGTEPMLRDDFSDIYLALIDSSLSIVIETNGTLLPSGLEDALGFHKAQQVSVSLDSSDRREHDHFRGLDGSFDRAVAFLEMLVSLGISTQIIMSLTRYDLHDVECMAGLAEELGVSSLKLNPIVPMGRGGSLESMAYDAMQRITFTREVFANFGPALDVAIPPAFLPLNRLLSTSNCKVLNLIGVLSDGKTSFCGIGLSRPDLIFGDLRRRELADIWRHSEVLSEIRDALPDGLAGVCRNCMHRKECLGYCVMENYVHSDSFFSPNPLCQTAFELGIFPDSRLVNV